jgi:hypothetical protein
VVDLASPGGDLGPVPPPRLEPDFYKYLVLSTVPTYLPCVPLPKRLWLGGYGFAAVAIELQGEACTPKGCVASPPA